MSIISLDSHLFEKFDVRYAKAMVEIFLVANQMLSFIKKSHAEMITIIVDYWYLCSCVIYL